MADAARERLWGEHPQIGATPTDAKQAAAFHLVGEVGRGKQSQMCHVVKKRAVVIACNCWILTDAIATVESVVNAMDRYNSGWHV